MDEGKEHSVFATRKEIDRLFGGGEVINPRKVFIFHCDYSCSINCEHCLMNGVPVQKTRIRDEVARALIKLCSELDLYLYPVSGDPFTWLDYLEKFLLPTLNSFKCKRIISTNGIWGSDRRMIERAKLLDLQHLVLTVDRFHQRFVPVSAIDNILDAFKDHKTKVIVASVWAPDIPADEIKLRYDLPRYELPMLSFTKYWHVFKDALPLRFFKTSFNGETVECRKNMFFVNDFDGNVYIECAAYLEGFPCKIGNVFNDSARDILRRKDGDRLKFKLYGEFDPTAPHTDACIDCQRAGLVKNGFFVDETFEVRRKQGNTSCKKL